MTQRANTPAGGVVVTQGDRNHAVRLLEDGGQDWQAKEIRIGDGDHFPIVQAFAAHRIASQAALLSALEGLLDSIGEADPRDGYCENSIHIDEVTAARAAIAAARSEVGK